MQKQKEKRSFSFLAMPSAAVTYPKLLQTSAETKRKTKFFIFDLCRVPTERGGMGMMVAIRRPTHRGGGAELLLGLVQHRKGPDAGGASGPWDSAYSGATIKTIRRCWGFCCLNYCS